MQEWTQFYAIVGAAAATLLGLLFVTVSLNASAALGAGSDVSKHLAEQAFQNYLSALLVALLALFPGITPRTFGAVVLSAAALSTAWVVARLYLTLSQRSSQTSWLFAL